MGPSDYYVIAYWTSMVGAWTMVWAVAWPIGTIVKALLILTGTPVD